MRSPDGPSQPDPRVKAIEDAQKGGAARATTSAYDDAKAKLADVEAHFNEKFGSAKQTIDEALADAKREMNERLTSAERRLSEKLEQRLLGRFEGIASERSRVQIRDFALELEAQSETRRKEFENKIAVLSSKVARLRIWLVLMVLATGWLGCLIFFGNRF